ncbi:hypothetical protein BC332_33560 [Capsicum chinense]|nr:hypothetical protein BC332_33560 [Capsicum chinense]
MLTLKPFLEDQDKSNGEPVGQHPKRADAEAHRRNALPTIIKEMAFQKRIKSPGFGCPQIPAGSRPESIGGPARRHSTSDRGASPSPINFSSDNFKHSVTLFSTSFSSFRYGSGHNGSLTLSEVPFQGNWDLVLFAWGSLVARRAYWVHAPKTREGFDNDPSAGSPTETLLRLLLPLNDKCLGAIVPWCLGALVHWCMVPWCLGALVPWCHGAMVPWCLSSMVPWCLVSMVPWCLSAMVPWCQGAMVPWCQGAMVLRCMVPWCHGATIPWCLRSVVPWCHGAMIPWFHGALVPWFHGAMVPRCLGALMPRCMVHDAWFHGVRVPLCHGAMVPWFLVARCPWWFGGEGVGARISNLTKTPPWLATICPSAFVFGRVSNIALNGHEKP